MNKQDIYQVTFSSSEITILGDYLKTIDSPAFPFGRNNQKNGGKKTKKTSGNQETTYNVDWNQYAFEFLGYFDDDNVTNFEKILNRFSFDTNLVSNINDIYKQGKYEDLPLKPGIRFSIPKRNISRATLLTQGINVASNDGAFKVKALYDLERDSRYTPSYTHTPNKALVGSFKELYPDLTVWLWCRSLTTATKENNQLPLTGQIFDITRFISNITTNMGKNGGNFEVQLAPIVCKRDNTNGYWSIDYAYYQERINNQDEHEFFSESQLNKIVSGGDEFTYETSRNTFLFHNCINTNDVIFIRHEPLLIEGQKRTDDIANKNSFVDKNNLPGRTYDMIGLIDSNRLNISPNNNDITVQIAGRDLSKLFIEDGTYFYALENTQGLLNFAGGTSAKNDLTRRIIGDNSLLYLSLYFNNSIEKILEFIIQQLSTIEVIPDDLFSGYGGANGIGTTSDLTKQNQLTADQRNHQFKLNSDSKTLLQQRNRKITDDKDKTKLLITNFRKKNKLQAKTKDSNYDSDKEKLYVKNILNKLIEFVETITNKNPDTGDLLAKITGPTNTIIQGLNTISGSVIAGWNTITTGSFVTDEDKIPALFFEDETALFASDQQGKATRSSENLGIINSVWNIVQEQNNLRKNLQEEEILGSGIWQIIDLVIDSSVSDRRVLDSSISSANGSLLNFVRKVCQEPFVEFFMDTYGDKYYLIVRKPPFDESSMIKYITGDVYTEKNNSGKVNLNEGTTLPIQYDSGHPLVMEIDDVDVISENLMFDDTDVYSWYHFTPKGSFFGNAEQFSLAYIPAVFFEEYAAIWGSKPMDIINNYVPYIPNYSKDTKQLDLFSTQAFIDLKYMIETNQYNPFVRKGSITINRDRRMKIGNPVRYKPTGEIFWIENVTHNTSITDKSIDATTTLLLSKGMIEKFIYGISGKELNELFPNSSYTPNEKFSYFNIINTKLDFTKKIRVPVYKTINTTTEVNNNQTINQDIRYSTGQTSTQGVQFIRNHEGQPALKAKFDQNGYYLAYGSHRHPSGVAVKNGDHIKETDVEDYLRYSLYEFEKSVANLFIPKPLLQNQFDALVSFCYNHGNGWPLRNKVVDFQKGLVSAEQLYAFWITQFIKTKVFIPGTNKQANIPGTNTPLWKINPNLVQRRKDEANLFLNKIVVLGTDFQHDQKQEIDHFEDALDNNQVLNNFKVNKEVFNFFLRRLQLDYFKSTNQKQITKTPQETSKQQVIDAGDNNDNFKFGKI